MKKIHKMPLGEQPRERLLNEGAAALSDLELLAVILGSGSQKVPVMELANRILKCIDKHSGQPPLQAMLDIPGIGPAKGLLLTAAMEFARRRIRPAGIKIRNSSDLLPLIRHYADRKQEFLLCTSLNGANEVIATRVVTVGLVNQAQIHPREVYADPILDRAASIVLAHNHPSGSVKPSEADILGTERLYRAGRLLGIHLIDHLIFTIDAHYSFLSEGKMPL